MRVETLFEQLFFTTVYIRVQQQDGSQAEGTGFIYQIKVKEDRSVHLLVTNKHVVENAGVVTVRFIASEDADMTAPLLGEIHEVTLEGGIDQYFTGHPDPDIDVTVSPIGPWVGALREQKSFVFFRSVMPALMMDRQSEETLDAMEQVTFLGYPNGLYDQSNYLPIARRGATATPPGIDYGGKPVFLVDASVFPGSSGSPVFVAETGGYAVRGGPFQVGNRAMLLGIVAAVYQRPVPVLQVPTATQSIVEDALDIGIVYKARTIDECADLVLDAHGLERYQAEDQDLVKQPSVPDPIAEAPPDDQLA